MNNVTLENAKRLIMPKEVSQRYSKNTVKFRNSDAPAEEKKLATDSAMKAAFATLFPQK